MSALGVSDTFLQRPLVTVLSMAPHPRDCSSEVQGSFAVSRALAQLLVFQDW